MVIKDALVTSKKANHFISFSSNGLIILSFYCSLEIEPQAQLGLSRKRLCK